MLTQDFINILVCPKTKQSLQLADHTLLQKINIGIKQSQVKNIEGSLITETIDGGLLRTDQQVLYPIRQNIPILLVNEAICLETIS